MNRQHLFFALIVLGISLLGCETKTTKISESQAMRVEDSTALLAPDTLKGTKIEAFITQVGSVILKNYSIVGKVNGLYGTSISIESIELINATDDSRLYGIVIKVSQGSSRYERESTSYIDYEEVEPLIEGLDYISKVDTSVTTLDFFEAQYHTKGEFQVAKFNDEKGNIFLILKSGSVSTSNAFFNIDKLASIRNLIIKAKQTLDQIMEDTTVNLQPKVD